MLYARRHRIENPFCGLEDLVRIGLRRDKTRRGWIGFAPLAAALVNLRIAENPVTDPRRERRHWETMLAPRRRKLQPVSASSTPPGAAASARSSSSAARAMAMAPCSQPVRLACRRSFRRVAPRRGPTSFAWQSQRLRKEATRLKTDRHRDRLLECRLGGVEVAEGRFGIRQQLRDVRTDDFALGFAVTGQAAADGGSADLGIAAARGQVVAERYLRQRDPVGDALAVCDRQGVLGELPGLRPLLPRARCSVSAANTNP